MVGDLVPLRLVRSGTSLACQLGRIDRGKICAMDGPDTVRDTDGFQPDSLAGPLEILRRHSGGAAPARMFVLSAPSGTGKDSVLAGLRRRNVDLHIAVACTTRQPRPNEVDGVDYHFVGREEFAEIRGSGEFLEDAVYAGHGYGTRLGPVREALSASRDVLLKIEVQGAATVRLKVPGAVLIFLAPASLDDLRERLECAAVERGVADQADIERRLVEARRELACLPGYDYLVVNHMHRLEETVRQIEAIILSERTRIGAVPIRV